ncbi:MAG: protein translocase subunit SecD [Proteobacteria bacterium]|nr:protein translocase subunit SecD [Pseudomonadota bacterium]
MLHVSNWVRAVVAAVVVAGILIALPNALPESVRTKMPAWLPSETVSLGLDLQGGVYMLFEVGMDSVYKDKLDSLRSDIGHALRKAKPRIGYEVVTNGGGTIAIRIKDPARFAEAHDTVKGLIPSSGGLLGGGVKQYDYSDDGHGLLTLKMTDDYRRQTQQEVVAQSIEVVRKRIDALGTREPSIERQGDDRIVVQVPGLKDPQHLIELLGKTAKMTFQLVDEKAMRDDAIGHKAIPPEDEVLPVVDNGTNAVLDQLVVERRVMVAGDRLVDAKYENDQRSGEPVVSFRFDTVGAKQFGDVTKAYPPQTQRFAIVLDDKIISAPRINEPILGGSGIISGSFTAQSAADLATLLRAGALPAPLKVIEQRSVGAGLGKDQIDAGRYSALAGLVLVALFMIARYGLFGLFADVALALNVILLLAALTLFGATLTLPGIAGIVLTMGMAVDANVLIYERMREEQRNGRSMLASIDQGFRRAMATIIDANSTHLIAALILFELGSGPVRGFAVTLGVGIATSFFTAVMVTRLIVVAWLNIRRPKRLAI